MCLFLEENRLERPDIIAVYIILYKIQKPTLDLGHFGPILPYYELGLFFRKWGSVTFLDMLKAKTRTI